MKLDVYKKLENGRVSQTEVEKTYIVDAYDLMYGTVEDIMEILDGVTVDGRMNNDQLLSLIQKGLPKIKGFMLDVFPDITEDELNRVKVRDYAAVFLDVFNYVKSSFGDSKN